MQRGGNRARLMSLLKLLAQVHNLHARERPLRHARRQCQQLIFSVPRVMVSLERRCRRTQQRRRAFHLCADDRHIASVISGSFLLFVTVLLFFIDDDESDIFQRREHRRTRPHHDARFAVPHAPPFARPLHVTQRRMQHCYALEPRAEPRSALPPHPERQRDLRYENDRGLPPRQCLLHRPQIHFGLAAARHAMQQLHAEFTQLKPCSNSFQRAFLLRIQFMRRRRVPRVKRIFRRIDRLLPPLQQPVTQHAFDHRPRHLRQLQKLRQRQRPALRLQQFLHAFFSALPLRALRLCVILFFAFLHHQFLSRRPPAFPRDHSLRLPFSSPHILSNFNESAALQPLQSGSINTQLCGWTEEQCSLLFFQLREKRCLSARESIRQFTTAQAVRRVTARIRKNYLALRFQFCHRRQHRAKNFAHRRQVIPRDPLRQFNKFRRERGN